MNLQRYFSTFQGLKTENRLNRIVSGVLLAAVLGEAFVIATRPQIVTIQPWTLAADAQITENAASESYIEAWGLALAELLGNVQPGSVDFIAERLRPLLAPEIYHRVMDGLQQNAEDLRDDRVSMRFEPRTVRFEKSTGLVFVTGTSYVRQGTSLETEQHSQRTYEFGIKIAHYAPLVTHITTYGGGPRTADVITRERHREEKELERERDRKADMKYKRMERATLVDGEGTETKLSQ